MLWCVVLNSHCRSQNSKFSFELKVRARKLRLAIDGQISGQTCFFSEPCIGQVPFSLDTVPQNSTLHDTAPPALSDVQARCAGWRTAVHAPARRPRSFCQSGWVRQASERHTFCSSQIYGIRIPERCGRRQGPSRQQGRHGHRGQLRLRMGGVSARSRFDCSGAGGEPPWRQPSGKSMVSLVNSHTHATRIGWHGD